MAAPDWVADGVALVAELLWVLVLEETVEGAERVLAEGEVGVTDGATLLDVKLLGAIVVEVATDPELEPPAKVELAAEVEDPTGEETVVEVPPSVEDPTPVELPENVEDPDMIVLDGVVELPEPELPVIPLRLKVPDQPV